MSIVFRPLTSWPGRLRDDDERGSGNQFRASWDRTTKLVMHEAEMIGGTSVVIQLALTEADIRLDGWPKVRSYPSHPGVTIVVPGSDHGRLSWSTDLYREWRHNVRAIALTMTALRAADRHGVMQGRQYAGFRELGAGVSFEPMTVEDAARFIAEHSGSPESWDLLANDSTRGSRVVARSYRQAAMRLHPDRGGDQALFQRLEQAKQILDGAAA